MEARMDEADRRAVVWDFLGYPGVFRALGATDSGCHQKQQMFKSLYLKPHFLASFPQ
jgi:hypothetical protein